MPQIVLFLGTVLRYYVYKLLVLSISSGNVLNGELNLSFMNIHTKLHPL